MNESPLVLALGANLFSFLGFILLSMRAIDSNRRAERALAEAHHKWVEAERTRAYYALLLAEVETLRARLNPRSSG